MNQLAKPVIEVENLRRSYADTVAADAVTLQVHEGEIFGILGPNGAGKTTTVECIAGLRTPDSGSVSVLGVDPQLRPDVVRENLGIQLQEAVVQAKLTVFEALDLYASFYEDPANPEDLIELLGLQEKRDTRFADLSGGQKQRTSIALALVGNPKIAILDELTTGLDPQARRDTWQVIEQVRRSGVTIILVTHFMEEAEYLCDRLVIIDHGQVIAQGTPAELIAGLDAERSFRMRLDEQVPLDFLTALPEVSRARHVGQEIEVVGGRRALVEVIIALAAKDIVPEDIRTHTTTLDDVFLSLTGREVNQNTSQEESP